MDAKQAFEIWWSAYPKKVGKKMAQKKWMTEYKDFPPLEKMLHTLEAQKRMPSWLKDDGEYIPHPTTYINNGRYDDELKVEMPKDIVKGKVWHETWDGIVEKGREIGIYEESFSHPQAFKAEIIRVLGEKLKVA